MPLPTPDDPTQSSPTSQASTSLLTPEQHLAMANLILQQAGKPGGPTKARAKEMARNHRVLAQVLQDRISQRQPPTQDGASSPT